MRNVIFVLLLILLLNCKTQTAKMESRVFTEVQQNEQFLRLNKSDFSYLEKTDNSQNSLLNFGYDFTLSSKDSTKPARITEYRNGKPFREIVAENATYTEKKSQKDSSNHKHSNELYGRISELQTRLEHQQVSISALEKITIRQKQDNIKLANNFKYLLWAVILFGIVYIGSSTGIFKAFKRLLNRT
ncbi:hypothetical protein ACQ1Q1_01245 [Ornithobacterium rhinotracheale]|uniref:Uncharacterized protein n=3 Tax=Ornithobacterium rhinotracheale TaxID=28251 RepID=I4A322_ORNRL|nr:hypothetical protein [Ornithobacterium rhinotracheale]AFL98356.1 hypothetical protein Ornrh_2225 [Ornithobacterium rhinotracheale DSM 15997]MBN3662799.1 hypothetical protein [Ornithobacterium rhinotracheale]UOH63349.1 hypothetical protein MT993_10070 [Ornithobacterium rhinotracheale]UOH66627.1 hypothetical protein MT999_04255 [Ornithobacterium rhinotracheale]